MISGTAQLREAGGEAQRLGHLFREKKATSEIHKTMKVEDRVNAELIFTKPCSTRS